MAAQIAPWHTRRESYWRILSYLMVPQSHHQHMRPPSHMQSIIDLNVINQCLAAVLYKLFSLGITSSFSATAQRWVAGFGVLKCIKLLFSVSSPAFHIHLVIAQPTVCQGCRSRCSAQLRTRRQALGRGTLQRRHTLHGEGCFRRRAGAWALPVSLLSYICRPSSLWVLVSNSFSQRPTLATHLCFPMPFP